MQLNLTIRLKQFKVFQLECLKMSQGLKFERVFFQSVHPQILGHLAHSLRMSLHQIPFLLGYSIG